jgi:hypothetical protein
MDDFLHNLRTNNPKAFDRTHTRGNFDGNRFKPNDRQNPKDKRKPSPQRPFNNGDQTLMLKKAVETLAEAAVKQAAVQERLVEAEERKATAMEGLIERLTQILGNQASIHVPTVKPIVSAPSHETVEPIQPSIPVEVRESIDRRALISRINQLRDKGTSYEKIAQIFEEEKVQTLSGRGKWRGQTIFRMSKETP